MYICNERIKSLNHAISLHTVEQNSILLAPNLKTKTWEETQTNIYIEASLQSFQIFTRILGQLFYH